MDYESTALTAELRAPRIIINHKKTSLGYILAIFASSVGVYSERAPCEKSGIGRVRKGRHIEITCDSVGRDTAERLGVRAPQVDQRRCWR